MISQEENDLITRTGPGTPCGELMRRYWQPAALAEELPPGGAPLPIRLLGEELVLFRDDQGRPGLLGIHCAHRGADLSYGRIEDGGLRCIYHGWLYDIEGRCLEQPGEPGREVRSSEFKVPRSSSSELGTLNSELRLKAYPCREVGGMILAYLGPGEPPLVPSYEFLTVADEHRFNLKILHECNYLQSLEGNLDPMHVPFLHQIFRGKDGERTVRRHVPGSMEVEITDFGVRLYRVSLQEGTNHARVTNFILPDITAIPAGSSEGYTVNWHVPIDDTHHWKYIVEFTRERPIDPRQMMRERSEMTDGYRLVRRLDNRHLQDREEMRTATFAGLGFGFQAHDAAVTESAGPIQDRTHEHLGYADIGIVAIRKVLRHAVEEVRAGREAPHVIRTPADNDLSYIGVPNAFLPDGVDWKAYLREQMRDGRSRGQAVSV